MSAVGNALRPQSPKAGDGLMTKLVKKMILRDGEIAAVEKLTDHFRLVNLKGEGLKNVDWTPGDKVQVNIGLNAGHRLQISSRDRDAIDRNTRRDGGNPISRSARLSSLVSVNPCVASATLS
jgi:hypothetical protein